jgi:hypothetical protein
MKYVQFYKLSTGYIEGTIPPQFREDAKKPIEAIGSNGVCVIDGRLNLHNALRIARRVCNERGFMGYSLHVGRSFGDSRVWQKYHAIDV